MFNRNLKKRLEWLENEVRYMLDLKTFKKENKKRKDKYKTAIPPVNRNSRRNNF